MLGCGGCGEKCWNVVVFCGQQMNGIRYREWVGAQCPQWRRPRWALRPLQLGRCWTPGPQVRRRLQLSRWSTTPREAALG